MWSPGPGFACPAHALRRVLAAHVPVWGYEFADADAPIAVPSWLLPYDMGAYHASEVAYVFGTKWLFADPARFAPAQRALSDRMRQAWAGFGHDAFPADWTPVSGGGGPVRVFEPAGDRMDGDFDRRHQRDFWATTVFGPVAPRD